MDQAFKEFVKEKLLFQPSEKILLGLSGGIDSVVLAHLLQQAKVSFGIAHVNFHLRGADSEEDARWAENIAQQYSCPFYLGHCPTAELAENEGISIQMMARNFRRQWFLDLKKKHAYDWIATAHHLNDSLETLLLNLSRGSGLQGLQGILPKKAPFIRPLLFASREDIEVYARENALTWREDQSNQSLKYYRNHLRHAVIPVLKKLNPSLEKTLYTSLNRLQMTEAYLESQIQSFKKQYLREDQGMHSLRIAPFYAFPQGLLFLERIIKEFGFSYHQARLIYGLDTQKSGQEFRSAQHILVKDRQEWIIRPMNHSGENVAQELKSGQKILKLNHFRLIFREEERGKDFQISKEPHQAVFDLDLLKFPLKVRNWRKGDYFYPLGMSGRKKLSDFFIDQKVSIFQKEAQTLLCSGEDIIWVIGRRIDDRYKISPSTQRILIVEQQV